MLFWSIAIAITAIACAALFYAAGRRVNAAMPQTEDANSHFRLVLAGIDADLAAGKLGEGEAQAAKGELAREILRLKAEAGPAITSAKGLGQAPLLIGLAGVAAVALGLYAALGSPNLPSQPLASRPELAAQSIDLEDAITRIESQLTANPDDLRGWTVIAPAYLELARYGDAARAYRRIIELSGPTADLQTSLAEALMLAADGAGSPEAMRLLRAAAASDPTHVLSRLYIAAELTRAEDYPAAASAWQEALALSRGGEPWLPAAQQGLAVAQNGGVAPANEAESAAIAQMVSGLAERLSSDGGNVEEWTQLIRAYLVLGETDSAQAAYDDAVTAYPQAFDRGEMDTLALGAGLTLNGVEP
ncbi:cytochrome c-type biogenesis protein CcmH [Devosia sp. YR412]|uniref:c-type cytochrome biogenesis protein CcmI n=1 Tax=Devosia sp. YR412 TaxID=1881030 RepID=UPI0008D3982C|nr:c-type cytochrome biogenesis protein CcmI [Devosia sp. YR412]SEP76480.1 cytochrome c-type biogenesis protein CcmH [Devosia sp. YR412]